MGRQHLFEPMRARHTIPERLLVLLLVNPPREDALDRGTPQKIAKPKPVLEAVGIR